jgi:hypothetical protein
VTFLHVFVCRTFSTSTNSIQTRITNMLSKALHSDSAPLASHYGAIVGLGELGHEVGYEYSGRRRFEEKHCVIFLVCF